MLTALALNNYRSLRELLIPLERLNLVTGSNGVGKSNLYKGLRLLSETAVGTATGSIAREGGLESVLWAGEKTAPVRLQLGFASADYSYSIDMGLPDSGHPTTGPQYFMLDPQIKRESIWHGPLWNERKATVDRKGPMVRARDGRGSWAVVEKHLPNYDSMLTRIADPENAPEILALREDMRAWRFYDHFRTDKDAPARRTQVGTFTPAMAQDGSDLAAAWATASVVGDAEALAEAVDDAFPGASVHVDAPEGRFSLVFEQRGLMRPLSQSELSDGTLRYLLWIAALLTPRPPTLMVLNEPETSLHPDLLPALARLMIQYAQGAQLWVTSHAPGLIRTLTNHDDCNHLSLIKTGGETKVDGQDLLSKPPWEWPSR